MARSLQMASGRSVAKEPVEISKNGFSTRSGVIKMSVDGANKVKSRDETIKISDFLWLQSAPGFLFLWQQDRGAGRSRAGAAQV